MSNKNQNDVFTVMGCSVMCRGTSSLGAIATVMNVAYLMGRNEKTEEIYNMKGNV